MEAHPSGAKCNLNGFAQKRMQKCLWHTLLDSGQEIVSKRATEPASSYAVRCRREPANEAWNKIGKQSREFNYHRISSQQSVY